MKRLLFALAGPAVIGVSVIVGLLVMIVGLSAMTLNVVVLEDDDDAEGQTVSARCTPGASPNNIPEEYQDSVAWAAQESGLSQELIAAQIDNESGWDPDASSGVAYGISQFTEDTWAQYGEGDIWDPQESIKAQGRYMKVLMDMHEDQAEDEEEQVLLALAAYNAGPGNVQQYDGVPPFQETQDYVQDIPAAAQGKFVEDCEQADTGGTQVGDLGSGNWTHPLPAGRHTSGFGPRPCPAGAECNEYTTNHYGVDFSTGGGTTIVAPTDIEITATGSNQYQGEYVIGRMADDANLVLQFHHCREGSTSVNKGDTVAVGTDLCTEGNTGNSSGAHLHFQVNSKDADDSQPTYEHAIDPEPVLTEAGVDY